MSFNSPLFVFTSDTDWASDACIDDVASTVGAFGIKPVFFATNASTALDRLAGDGRAEVGVHPNFRAGSTHGADVASVIEHVCGLFPAARSYRAHGFFDTFEVGERMRAKGMRYDSNLCLDMQAGLPPLQHVSGTTRFPIFWEDNIHWLRHRAWNVSEWLDTFLTPGLKVLNVHPANFALNVPDQPFYQSIRGAVGTLTEADLAGRRYSGAGTRTFVIELLERLRALGHRFWTLAELYAMTRRDSDDALAGRQHQVSEQEYHQYWQWTAEERQAWVRRMYDQHNPLDPYATSRDHNLRDLEIEAIGRHLPQGQILDLGCGNGYTLLSLARQHPARTIVGVDFSTKMIEGAHHLKQTMAPGVDAEFVCADAIAYVQSLADNRTDGVVTERFLLNLPNPETQRQVITQIHRVLKPGGRLLMCEGSLVGFRELNRLRTEAGLAAVAERSGDNASAIRFEDAEIEAFCERVGLTLTAKLGFSDYFVISRVVHPLLVAPQPPRFSAPINEVARRVQSDRPFAAGVGSNVVWVYEKRAE